jgi:hypothetical protein
MHVARETHLKYCKIPSYVVVISKYKNYCFIIRQSVGTYGKIRTFVSCNYRHSTCGPFLVSLSASMQLSVAASVVLLLQISGTCLFSLLPSRCLEVLRSTDNSPGFRYVGP